MGRYAGKTKSFQEKSFGMGLDHNIGIDQKQRNLFEIAENQANLSEKITRLGSTHKNLA